jgi:hypothetical protein
MRSRSTSEKTPPSNPISLNLRNGYRRQPMNAKSTTADRRKQIKHYQARRAISRKTPKITLPRLKTAPFFLVENVEYGENRR